MNHFNPHIMRLRLFLFLGCIVTCRFAVGGASAAEESAAEAIPFSSCLTNSSVVMEVAVSAEAVAGRRAVARVVAKSNAGKFSFVIPQDYHLEGGAGEHVTVVGQRGDRFIKCRLIQGAGSMAEPSRRGELRAYLGNQYADARVTAESTGHAGNKSGPSFDLAWTITGGVQEYARVLFVPCGSALIEVSLVASASQANAARQELNGLLLTFTTAGPQDELVAPTISSRL